MRTGAIFARGSCRALKWMALFGVLLALGAGEAAAQTLTVSTSGTVPEGANRVPVTVRLQAPAPTDGVRAETVTVTLTLTPRPTDVTDRGKEAELDVDEDASWAAGETGQNVNASAGTVEITFNNVGNDAYDWTERAYLNIGVDVDAENEEFVIESTSSDAPGDDPVEPSGKDVKVKIADAQTQVYTLLPKNFGTKNTIKEGGQIELELKADPARTVDVTFRVELASDEDDSDYGLDSLNSESQDVEIQGTVSDNGDTPGDGTAAVTLYSEDNDVDRVDDSVTLTTEYGGDSDKRGDQAAEPLVITVLDQHKLPKVSRDEMIEITVGTTKSKVTTLMEGQKGTVKLLVDRTGDGVASSEDIEIALAMGAGSTADGDDYRLDPTTVKVGGAGTSGSTVLDVLGDQDVGDETLMLMATVSGDEDYGDETEVVMLDAIDFMDATIPKIEPKSVEDIEAAIMAARTAAAGDNGLWTVGDDPMTLEASDLFTWPETTQSVVLSNAISEDQQKATASTTNDSLTITAMGDGMTDISVNGTAVTESSVIMRSQTVSNFATVKFSVTVDPPAIIAKDDVQAAANAAVAAAAAMARSGNWEPGGAAATIALSDLFDVPASIDARYLAESSDDEDVMADVSGMNLELMPMSAGMATVTVTAVDTDRPGNAVSVDFDVTVMAVAAITGKTPADVNAVFEAAGADDLVVRGPSISVMINELFEVGPGVTPTYLAGSSDDDVLTASASGMTLKLTPGQGPAGGPATITVTALDPDSDANASVEYMATVDDLAHVLTITSMPMSGSMVDEGGSITVAANLNQAAPAAMSVALDISGPASGATEIMVAMGEMSGSATLDVDDDNVVMAMPAIVIVASHAAIAGGSAVLNFSVTEDDVETTYSVTPAAVTVTEGGDGMMITATASQAVMANTEVMLMHGAGSASEDDYMLEPVSITILAGGETGSTMLTAHDDTDVEGTEMVTLNAMLVGGMSVGTVEVTIEDDDMETTYEVTPAAVTVTEGGAGMMITATASQPVLANTEVMLMHGAGSASESDYMLEPVSITILAGGETGSTMLTAHDDYDVEGMEMVTLNAMLVGGMSVGTVEVTIEDDDMETTYELTASADMVDEGGEAVTITATVIQGMVREDTLVELTAVGGSADDNDYSLDPMMITIAAGEDSGSTMLTATDDYDVEGTETLRLQGAVGSMIVGQVLLEIGDNDMEISYSLSGPDDMNLVEGMSYELMATADSAVPMDTEVTVMRDRSMSDADEDDYSVESIMIAAGGTTGTSMLMVTDDNMEDSGHGSPEMLVLYGMVDGMNTNSVSFYVWDAAVPALPVIAQLLLAAFLAIGGYRRYLRR